MFLQLKKASNCTVSTFSACRHGSKRDKQTSFWHNVTEFCTLEGGCPGGHEHAPWGVQRQANRKVRFATGSEAAYPHLLCERMAACLQKHFIAAGFPAIPAVLSLQPLTLAINPDGQLKAEAGKQGRGKRNVDFLPRHVQGFFYQRAS